MVVREGREDRKLREGHEDQREHPEVLGSYQILSLIGEGATGQVYKAEHTILGRRVALKTLRPKYSKNPNIIQRFFSEARAVNEIEHENIVAITDFVVGEEEHASFYIMELLEGRTLADGLVEGAFSVPRTIEICEQLASALSAAHAKNIIHRDLKPANILLVPKGDRDFVKLLDFGVAKLSVQGNTPLTKVGTLLGTPGYMSPEGSYGLEIDARADVYSFGVVMHEMLSGRRLFVGETVKQILEAQRDGQIAPLPADIPEPLAELVMACLATHPKRRPSSMKEVHERLGQMKPQPATPSVSVVVPVAPERSVRWPLGLALVMLLVMLGGVAWLTQRNEGASAKASPVIVVPTKRPKPSPPPVILPPVKMPVVEAVAPKPEEPKAEPEVPKKTRRLVRKRRGRRLRTQAARTQARACEAVHQYQGSAAHQYQGSAAHPATRLPAGGPASAKGSQVRDRRAHRSCKDLEPVQQEDKVVVSAGLFAALAAAELASAASEGGRGAVALAASDASCVEVGELGARVRVAQIAGAFKETTRASLCA